MHNYVISMYSSYDCYEPLEHFPVRSKYTKKEILSELKRIYNLDHSFSQYCDHFMDYCGSKGLPILDTELRMTEIAILDDDNNFRPPDINTVDEWFEKYAIGAA